MADSSLLLKTLSMVAYSELNLLRSSVQAHFELPDSTVFQRILQRLL